jgi:cyclophilin family peptidyl-prolyl cis-trans isomerase
MTTLPTQQPQRRAPRLIGLALASLLIAGCGGGGDDPAPIPTVSSVSVVPGSAKFSQQMVIAVTGTDVDRELFVTSPSCTGMTLSMTSPYVSNSATAYYRCRVTALGTNLVTVARAVDQVTLGSAAFTVAQPQVTMSVSDGVSFTGTMVFTLFPTEAPLTVNNFLNYVNSGFYLGTIFHRVNNTTGVVQGGGYLPLTVGAAPVLKTATFAPVPLEVGRGLSNVPWSLGMARGAALDSATSQFYINVLDNASLDGLNGGYAVFGTVSSGTNVVTAMDTAPCTTAFFASTGSECAPIPNIQIIAATQTQ